MTQKFDHIFKLYYIIINCIIEQLNNISHISEHFHKQHLELTENNLIQRAHSISHFLIRCILCQLGPFRWFSYIFSTGQYHDTTCSFHQGNIQILSKMVVYLFFDHKVIEYFVESLRIKIFIMRLSSYTKHHN